MSDFLIIAWPLIGIVCGLIGAGDALETDPFFGTFIILFCGAIVGPFGVFWIVTAHKDKP